MKKLNLELKHWLALNCKQDAVIKAPKTKANTAKARVFLGSAFPATYFTTREAQCVYLLLQHKKRKEIATGLGLSIRTIEAYITEAKAKTKTHSQKELAEVIKKTDFLQNYLKAKAIKQRCLPTELQQAQPSNSQLPTTHSI